MSTSIDLENTYTSGVYGKRPVAIVRGSGALLWDDEGHEYIDCMAGHGVANIGHGRSEIAATLAEQALRITTCSETLYNDVRAHLLERLAQITPEGISRFFLCNSGTEAVEGALKFARLATGRTGIIAALRSFHGRTMGALSATWEPHYREPFAPLIPGVTHVRYNNLEAAEQAINENTAAVLIELVQGEGGVHVASPEYIQGLATLCRERGALLIVDEIQTGFGRTGRLFACEHYDLQPDILCLAKALGGGVPMGAIGLGERVIASGRISKGVHGSTFGGNPLACAAALTTLNIIEQEALPQRAATLGAYALERLRTLRTPLIREVRGRGLMIGIEQTRRVQPYLETLCERGVLALPAGPNVLRLLPPLVITEAQLDRVLNIVADVLGATPSPNVPDLTSSQNVPDPEVALLHNMLTIPSYSRQEGALARYLAEQAAQMGLYSYVDEVGNFVASTSPRVGGPLVGLGAAEVAGSTETHKGSSYAGADGAEEMQPIVLLGHMDTVTGNIPVRIEDGLLYGRGAVDAKGPLAAFICAAARLARNGHDQSVPTGMLERPIVVIGAVEEEAPTSRGAHAVVDRYRPAACIIGEPSSSQAVTIGYKGSLLIEGSATRSSSHSAGPQASSNEVATAFWERVRSHAAGWNEQHANGSAFASLLPSLRSINSTLDGLEEQTRFVIGYRLPPGYDIAGLHDQLERWAADDNLRINFVSEEAAFQTSRTIPLARAFIAAIRSSGGQPTFKHKTGTSDMNVVGPVWGENIVAYGPGDSRLDHTPNEHIRIAEYTQAIAILEDVLGRLALRTESPELRTEMEASSISTSGETRGIRVVARHRP